MPIPSETRRRQPIYTVSLKGPHLVFNVGVVGVLFSSVYTCTDLQLCSRHSCRFYHFTKHPFFFLGNNLKKKLVGDSTAGNVNTSSTFLLVSKEKSFFIKYLSQHKGMITDCDPSFQFVKRKLSSASTLKVNNKKMGFYIIHYIHAF